MQFRFKLVLPCSVAFFLIAGAVAQTPDASATSGTSDAPRATIALSPAIIMVRCKPGQGTTQTLTISNQTSADVSFRVETEDVVVTEGTRSFRRPGR